MQRSDETPGTDRGAPPKGRGRPRAFDRDKALQQAMRLFWLKGYDATSLSELTEAMGINSPSLYAAFGSKEALYVEALRCYRSTYDAIGLDGIEARNPVRHAVECYLLEAADVLTAPPEDHPSGCMVTLGSVSRDNHRDLHDFLRSERAVTLERVEARLARGASEGQIPEAVDVAALARFLVTVLFGMSIHARDGASASELADVARIAMLGFDARTDAGP